MTPYGAKQKSQLTSEKLKADETFSMNYLHKADTNELNDDVISGQ
jgi:hypothetical protein